MNRIPSLVLFLLLTPGLIWGAERAPCWIKDAASVGERVWLLCDRGEILFSADSGRNWKTIPVNTNAELTAIEFLNASRGVAAGRNGAIFLTEDGGASWKKVNAGTESHILSLHFRGELGWASGYDGLILHTRDGGRTWERQRSGVVQSLECIYFADAEYGWAVGWGNTILRTTDGGATWNKIDTPAARWWLSSVYFKDRQNGWIVGMFGQIIRSRDGGLTWEGQESPTRAWLTNIVFDNSGRGWITAENDLLVSRDGGETWIQVGMNEQLFLERFVRVGDSWWAVGPFAVLRNDGGGQSAWRKLDTFQEWRPSLS